MYRTRIKICGIKEREHAQAAVDAGADYIGLVFVEKSPRFVTLEQADAVVSAMPNHVDAVGLFVDHDPQEIKGIAEQLGLSVVQLHGHEEPSALDELSGLRVWKALPFTQDLNDRAEAWDQAPRLEALLIDTPPQGELTGGSGVAFEWAALAEIKDQLSKPIILAGGLTPANVHEAIEIVRPYAVDVSSGVESSRGVKDPGLIWCFSDSVTLANHSQ
ncbi:MAG: phosphoribosylanthranilate isomerase [Planctomycetota bacterium]